MLVETSLRQVPLAELPAAAARLERLGFDGLAQPELRNDPFLTIGLLAASTERLTLATSVALAFPRSPMVVAYLARDLQELSAGRFRLGLGTQVRGHIERRYSVPWDSPGPRLRDYLQALRAIWRCWDQGEPLDYQSRFYRFSLMTPEFSPEPSRYGPIPIQIAAVNRYNLQLAGELCDGLRLHPFCTVRYLRDVVRPSLQSGAARSGRDLAHFALIGGGFVVTGGDPATVARGREEARRRVGFYGSTRVYRPVLELHGWGELGTRLGRLAAVGRWEALAGEVDDEVLEAFCVAGTYEQIGARVADRFAGLLDWLQLPLPADALEQPDRLSGALHDLSQVPGRSAGA
jgi:probable F420-dependent oxidoreductase